MHLTRQGKAQRISARPRTREMTMDKLVLGWLLGVPVLMLIVLQYLM